MGCNKLGVWKQLYAQMTAGEDRSWENVELLEINQESNEKGKMYQVISVFRNQQFNILAEEPGWL